MASSRSALTRPTFRCVGHRSVKMPRSPAVIRRVSRLHRDERPTERGADLAASPQLRLDDGPVVGYLDRPRDELDRTARRRRASEPHRELRRDRRRRRLRVGPPHEVISSRPVRVTVEEGPCDAAGKKTGDCPMPNCGYGVSAHRDVDPTFGNLADFDRRLSEAHRRTIRVIVDMVPAHTSDQHPWFKAARSSRTDPKRAYYIWADPRRGAGPPNNWRAVFRRVGSAWTLDTKTGQDYLHHCLPEQPDLNWRND